MPKSLFHHPDTKSRKALAFLTSASHFPMLHCTPAPVHARLARIGTSLACYTAWVDADTRAIKVCASLVHAWLSREGGMAGFQKLDVVGSRCFHRPNKERQRSEIVGRW